MKKNELKKELISIIKKNEENINENNNVHLLNLDKLIDSIGELIKINASEDLFSILEDVLYEKNETIIKLNQHSNKFNYEEDNLLELEVQEIIKNLKDKYITKDDSLEVFEKTTEDLKLKRTSNETPLDKKINKPVNSNTDNPHTPPIKAVKNNISEKIIKTSTEYGGIPLVGGLLSFILKKYNESKENNEQHLFFLTFISSILMIIGAYWGIDYALEKGYIPVGLRTFIGVFLSMLMIFYGNKIYKKELLHGLSLFSVGILSFYGLYYFVIMYYQFNVNIGFLFIMLSSLFLFYHSNKENQPVMFLVALLASGLSALFFTNINYLSDMFIIFNSNNYLFQDLNSFLILFSFLLISFYANIISMKNNYNQLNYISFILLSSIGLTIISNETVSGNLSLFFIFIFSSSFILPVLFKNYFALKEIEKLTLKPILYMFSIFMYFIGNVLYIVEEKTIFIYFALFIIFSLIVLLSFCAKKIKTLNSLLFSFIILMIVSLVSILGFYYFEDYLSIILLIEGICLMFIGYKEKIGMVKVESLILMFSAFINLFTTNFITTELMIISSIIFLSSILVFEYNFKNKILFLLEILLSLLSTIILMFLIVIYYEIPYLLPVISVLIILANYRNMTQIIFISILTLITWLLTIFLIEAELHSLDKIILFTVILISTQIIRLKDYTIKIKTRSELTLKYLIAAIPLFIMSSILKRVDGEMVYILLIILSMITYLVGNKLPEFLNHYNTKYYYKPISLFIMLVASFIVNELYMIIVFSLFFLYFLNDSKLLLKDMGIDLKKANSITFQLMSLVFPLVALNYIQEFSNSLENLLEITLFALLTIVIYYLKNNHKDYILKNKINHILYIMNTFILSLLLVDVDMFVFPLIIVFMCYISWALKDIEFKSEFLLKTTYFLTPFFVLFETYMHFESLKVYNMPELIMDFFILNKDLLGIYPLFDYIYLLSTLLFSAILLFVVNKLKTNFVKIGQIQILIILSFINIYLFVFLLIVAINLKRFEISENIKSILYIVIGAFSPLLFVLNSESNICIILSYLVFLVPMLSNAKGDIKVLFMSIMLILNNVILAEILNNNIYTGVILTFILLIPLIFSFYKLVVLNESKYKITYYVLLSIVLIKLGFIDFNITGHLKELIIVFGVILFFITFIAKRLKNNK